jgi:RNA polymerase sigma-70 factor (ECF subfamily)
MPQQDPEMHQTLVQAAAGDRDAFEQIVREHASMVFSIACHCLRDQAVAEELSQEVFLELFRHMADIESPAHLTFWLRKVATNRAIDYSRRKEQRNRSLEELPEPAVHPSVRDPLLSGALEKLVRSLPETPRAIVTLRYQEDMPLAEIAAALEIPLNTVKSHLQRALLMLRQKLERRLGEVNV